MSDFDAEAERKRLREKYEADEENRKRTQQMSELLLKGATMTNRHCGECGSPIFRYDGQEFCPSCQRTMDGEAGDDRTDPSAEASTDAAPDAEASADTAPTGAGDAGDATDATAAGGAAPPESEAPTADAGADATPATPGRDRAEAARGTNDPAAANGVSAAGSAAGSDRGHDAGRGAAGGSPPKTGSDAVADPETEDDGAAPTRRAARESLLAALTRHARLAADTDEPRRATDHLEAARTAAAALDELDGS
ncbi:Sjogren's syndrome/scleroderma autoantigen 1 family protein [Halobellus ruber]|uniref:Sjogren's syndrome/scleroderma autoantigen 1 (Autoantigen p27) n=1 Tax=Halobellus ruber TaxID=2761102 RepID=A0A7J9SMJ6_9EURY|nr:Sjogren's syndrome/scleroderma autoantigen 1 family protein [Halobellus ruber]MBB6647296.1 hypothetical protein [Halobellus ruber]